MCCSGTFRIESVLRAKYNSIQLPIYSNDVSLYSEVIAAIALDEQFPITFIDRLSFLEDYLEGRPFEERAAGVMVAFAMARFSGKNLYSQQHFAWHQENVEGLLEQALTKLSRYTSTLDIQGYWGGDFRARIEQAIDRGAGILSFPPFFKGGYEVMFKFLNENIRWDAPNYDLYDPTTLPDILDNIEESGVPHCILTDQVLPGRTPILEFVKQRRATHYCYGASDRSSLRKIFAVSEAFTYKPIDPWALKHSTEVKVVPIVNSRHANFIKDVYLSKHIIHSSGHESYFVFLDGRLAGCIIFKPCAVSMAGFHPDNCIFLLSDSAMTTEGKISKLIALLATSTEFTDRLSYRYLIRIEQVVTTVWTDRYCSMKYRGVFNILKKEMGRGLSSADSTPAHTTEQPKSNFFVYGSAPRDKTFAELYKYWYGKYYTKARNQKFGQATQGH